MKVLEWNVYYKNNDMAGLAKIIKKTDPDIAGFCELDKRSKNRLAREMSKKSPSGRTYKVQPGDGGGYGTDIIYDGNRFEALEGGKKNVFCKGSWTKKGSQGGSRAANYVVLKEKTTGKKIITGGIHVSYCSGGCPLYLWECETGKLYDAFEKMKKKHGNPPVLWMGDQNYGPGNRMANNLFKGKIGRRKVFPVEDLGKIKKNTYFSGGSPIDWFFGEKGKFKRIKSGRVAGRTGKKLVGGADHFPIYVQIDW